MHPLDIATHGTVIATVGTLVAALYNGTLFAWHPILMSLGFLGAMAEGVLTAVKFRRLEGPPRAAAIQRHFWIQLLAVTAVAGGFWAIYQNKVNASGLRLAMLIVHSQWQLKTGWLRRCKVPVLQRHLASALQSCCGRQQSGDAEAEGLDDDPKY